MVLIRVAALTILASFAALYPIQVSADDTGVAQSLHDTKIVKGRLCMDGHFHYGDSSGAHRSKKLAMKSAITSWQEFTAYEYGTDWAYFKFATVRSAKCSRSSAGWTCDVDGSPCNRKRLRRRRRR